MAEYKNEPKKLTGCPKKVFVMVHRDPFTFLPVGESLACNVVAVAVQEKERLLSEMQGQEAKLSKEKEQRDALAMKIKVTFSFLVTIIDIVC